MTATPSTATDRPIARGDIVWVPFPFVEAPRVRNRPAFVVSVQTPKPGLDLLWVLMITSAANKGWKGDVSLEACFAECGLTVPCVIRTAKVTTVEASLAQRAGSLPAAPHAMVSDEMRRRLALL